MLCVTRRGDLLLVERGGTVLLPWWTSLLVSVLVVPGSILIQLVRLSHFVSRVVLTSPRFPLLLLVLTPSRTMVDCLIDTSATFGAASKPG